jgi:hypothetical protein
MAKKISYYLRQSAKYTMKSKLSILTLALAVSMVAGFGYYFDSAQAFTVEKAYTNVFDFEVDFVLPENEQINFTITENMTEISSNLLDSDLNLLANHYFRNIQSSYVKLAFPEEETGMSLENFEWIIGGIDLYESSRFHDYYKIVSGQYPENPNDIMVEQQFASIYNITVDNPTNFLFKVGLGEVSYLNLTELNIVGIYKTKVTNALFGNDQSTVTGTKLFTWSNFSTGSLCPPIEHIYNTMGGFDDLVRKENYGLSIKSAVGFVYPRDSINVAWLSATAKDISQIFSEETYPYRDEIEVYNFITPIISSQFKFQTELRLSIQFTNIPLFLFAIYMGSIANKSNIIQRYHEFFSMRMRGFPKSMIRKQLLYEAAISSIISSVIGLILGVGIFEVGQKWLNPIFLPSLNVSGSSLSFHMTFTTIIETLGFGMLLSFLAKISTIRHINRLKTSALASALVKHTTDVDYDETSLYISKDADDQQDKESDLLDIRDFMKKKEDLIPKWGLWVALLSLIPVILQILLILGQEPLADDSLVEISTSLQGSAGLITIVALASPFFLVSGLLHFLLIESPQRLARISKKISHVFMKNRDYFVGLEMVRQKQFIRVISLIGIFISAILFTNISLNTLTIQKMVSQNYEIGADIKMEYSVAGQVFDNRADLDQFESQIDNMVDSSGEKIFTESTKVYCSSNFRGQVYDYNFYTNFTEYRQVIDIETKKMPYSSLSKDIDDIIQFNMNLSDSYTGVIVSSTYLEKNDLFIGDTIHIQHNAVNFSSGRYLGKTILAKVIKVIDVMPGLYFDDKSGDGYIALSSHVFNFSADIVPSKEVVQLISFNPNNIKETQDYPLYLLNSTNYKLLNADYEYYNFNWDQVSVESYNLLNIPYLGLFYFNLIIIGVILAVGLAILVLATLDENKEMYGELLARGFGRKGLQRLILSEMVISFLLAIVVGMVSGGFTAVNFSEMYILSLGGGYLSPKLSFNYQDFGIILGIVIGLTTLLISISLYLYSKQEIIEFLEEY